MKRIILFWALLLCINSVQAQIFKKDSVLLMYASGSISYPDKRLFDFPTNFINQLISDKGTIMDVQFDVGFLKQCLAKNKWNAFLGIGFYGKYNNFPRPFEKRFIGGGLDNLLIFLTSYSKYGVQVPFHLIRPGSFSSKSFFQLSAISNFTLFKHARAGNSGTLTFQKFVFQPDNIDFLAGFNLKMGRGALLIQTRFLNISKIDKVIINQQLFNSSKPPLLRRKIDFYTMPKLQASFWIPLSKK